MGDGEYRRRTIVNEAGYKSSGVEGQIAIADTGVVERDSLIAEQERVMVIVGQLSDEEISTQEKRLA
jgi:hypothetical protein